MMSANKHLKTTLEQIDQLMDEYLQNPSLIILELIQEKTRTFYEELHVFKNESFTGKETAISNSENYEFAKKPIIVKETRSQKTEKKESPKVDTPKKQPKNIVEETKIELKPQKEVEAESEQKKKVKTDHQPEKPVFVPQQTIADRYSLQTSMNDLLSKIEKDPDLATQLQNRPIENLKNAISLNDRIWFVKELFNNDADLFNQTVEQINQANSKEEAISRIENFAWDQDSDSTRHFISLIYRLFV